MNITFFPFAPMSLISGSVFVFTTSSPKVYTDFCVALRDGTEEVMVSDDDYKKQALGKSLTWYGDPLLELDLNTLFQKLILKRLLADLTDTEKTAFVDQELLLQNMINQALFKIDLPLVATRQLSVDGIFKSAAVEYNKEVLQGVPDVLELLIKTLVELADHRIVVLTNLSHYLTAKQFEDFVQLVKMSDRTVFLIEFSSMDNKLFWGDCPYVYIDDDFVDSR